MLPNLDKIHQWLNETDANGNNKIIISLSVFNAISSINGNAITLTNNIGILKIVDLVLLSLQYKDGSSANFIIVKYDPLPFNLFPEQKTNNL